jgi:hypothetical protein
MEEASTVKKGSVGMTVLLGAIFAISCWSWARSYAIYYDCSRARDTGLVVMNSGGGDTYYTIKVYDAYGTLLEAVSDDLSGYQSAYYRVSGLIEWGDTTWGLLLVETPGLLTIGVEAFDEDVWLSSDNVVVPVPPSMEYTTYWYGLNYANTSTQQTLLVVANPNNDVSVEGTLFFYDSLGNVQERIEFDLDPHEADFYRSPDLFDVDETLWGVLDVEGNAPLLVAVEYYNEEGALLNIDQMAYAYFVE